MAVGTRSRRSLQLFTRKKAPDLHTTTMMRPPVLDQPALDALPEFSAAGGSELKMLFGDPEGPGGGGLSLVWIRFGAHYPLPRHSHSVDCLYYVVSGEVHLGNQVLGPGDGFFVPADAPYGYTAGPDGVELLEFRGTSSFDSRTHESEAGWSRILKATRANKHRWGNLSA